MKPSHWRRLKTFLWKSADILRGAVDSAEYKKYIFGLLFYKRINDMWFEEYEEQMERHGDKEIAEAEHNHRFQLPKDCYWEELQKKAEGIGAVLNKIFEKITVANTVRNLIRFFRDWILTTQTSLPMKICRSWSITFHNYNSAIPTLTLISWGMRMST